MEMIVVGEDICGEGRYRKAFVRSECCLAGPQSMCSLLMKTVSVEHSLAK
jgi:hypothetical protein